MLISIKRKRLFIVTVLICVMTLIGAGYGYSKSSIKENKIKVEKEKIVLASGKKIMKENGKIKEGLGVHPTKEGNKALVTNEDGDGFVLIDNNGNILDDFNDLKETMKKIKKEKALKTYTDADHEHEGISPEQVDPYYLWGINLISDETLLFTSNYDSENRSLWIMDMKKRKAKKVLENIAYIFSNETTVLVEDLETSEIIELELSSMKEKKHKIKGHILATSPNGKYITFQPYKKENVLDGTIGFYNVTTQESVVLDELGSNDSFYSHGGVFNESGDKFAFHIHHKNDLDTHEVLVFHLAEQRSTTIPEGEHEFALEYDSLRFVDDTTLEVFLVIPNPKDTNGEVIISEESVQYSVE